MFEIDFYQHLILATWLYLILQRWFTVNRTFFIVLGVAFLWDVAEIFYNLEAYTDFNHYLKDTAYDLIAALIACIICWILQKRKKVN